MVGLVAIILVVLARTSVVAEVDLGESPEATRTHYLDPSGCQEFRRDCIVGDCVCVGLVIANHRSECGFQGESP
jgi:hypothetical protein